MRRKKTHDDFVADIRRKYGSTIIVVSKYEGKNTNMTFFCTRCRKTFEREAISVSREQGKYKRLCPRCDSVHAIGRARKKLSENVSFSSNKSDAEANFTCSRCGFSEIVNIFEFLEEPLCHCQSRKKLNREFYIYVNSSDNSEFVPITRYKNARTKVDFIHSKCGHVTSYSPIHFYQQKMKCIKCEAKRFSSIKTLARDISVETNYSYALLHQDSIKSGHIKVIHTKCGEVMDTTVDKFRRGARCGICDSSKGESAITEVLANKALKFSTQYRIDECKHKRALPFDFAVFSSNDFLAGLIEYDGEQHFRPISYFGGEENYEGVKLRDAIKTKYCDDNGIPLLRIPYTEFDNIEAIVTKWLNKIKDHTIAA